MKNKNILKNRSENGERTIGGGKGKEIENAENMCEHISSRRALRTLDEGPLLLTSGNSSEIKERALSDTAGQHGLP